MVTNGPKADILRYLRMLPGDRVHFMLVGMLVEVGRVHTMGLSVTARERHWSLPHARGRHGVPPGDWRQWFRLALALSV